MIAEYEEELSSTKQHQLLDAVLKKHQLVLLSTDIHQLIGHQETCLPPLLGASFTLECDYPQPPHVKEEADPQPPNIKEEREDTQHPQGMEEEEHLQSPYIQEEGERESLLGQEEADLTKFPLTLVSVKTEDHEEKPPESSRLHHSPNVCEEHLSEQQEWTSRMKQEEPQPLHIKEEEVEPQDPHIKEEEEEHSISQEEKHIEELEKVDVPKMPLTGVTVKSEDEFKDIHQLIGHQETCLPPLQGGSFTLECDYPQPPLVKEEADPQPPNIKEEREDTQHPQGMEEEEHLQSPYIQEEGERECLLGQEEADLTKFPLTLVSVKTEDHEEKPPESSRLHHSPNVCEEHLPEQQEWTSRMKQEEPQSPHIKEEEVEPQDPHIKEEEEEHSISQEEKHIEELEKVDVPKMPLTGVTVKSEDEFKDIHQLIGHQETCLPPLQGGSFTLECDYPQPPHVKEEEDPQSPKIKEEKENTQHPQGMEEEEHLQSPYIHEEGERECLLGQEEADLTKFPLTGVSVKTEDHEEKPPESSRLHHSPNLPEQQEWTSRMKQEEPQPPHIKEEEVEPQDPHVKEEEEEHSISQEEKHIEELEKVDVPKMPLTGVTVKSEDEFKDIHQLIGHQETCLPPLQGGSFTLECDYPQPPHVKEEEDPQPPNIKEEKEDTQHPQGMEEEEHLQSPYIQEEGERECLLGQEEADLTKFPLTGVSVKTEDHEEKPPESSRLHHSPNLPEQQEWTSRMKQEEPQPPHIKEEEVEPQDPHVKEEEEEHSISQEEKHIEELEKVDVPKMPLTGVTVKSEDEFKDLPEQQEWTSRMKQEEPQPPHIKEEEVEPQDPHVKEEEEEHSISQEEKHIEELEKVDVPKMPLTGVTVKSEDEFKDLPEQQEWTSRMKQEEPQSPHIKEEEVEPQDPHVKEEEEEHSISQEEKHIEELEKVDVPKMPLTGVTVKSEDEFKDIHQLIGHQETCLPPLQRGSFTLECDYPQPPHVKEEDDPQPPNIKEEKEDTQHPQGIEEEEYLQSPYIQEEGERECLLGQEEADLTKFPLTLVSVKTEDHEEKPPESSRLHHSPNLPEQQEWTSRMKQEEPQPPHVKEEEVEPQDPHVKEEEEEHSISQEEKHIEELEKVDVPKMPLTGVTVKSEDEFKGDDKDSKDLPEQQEWTSRMKQEEPQPPHIKEEEVEPQDPHVKEEEEEHSISQEEKHIEELEKVDVPKMPLTGVTVKSEDEFKGDDKDSKDIHQLIGHQETCLPPLQGGSFTLECDYPQPPHVKEEEDPQPPNIKEEKEDTQHPQGMEEEEHLQPPYIQEEGERECLLGQEEADLTKFPLTGVSVKTEDHEEKPPESSQLHHSPNLPEQQEWTSRMKQEEPQPPHVKEEEVEPQDPHIKEEEEEHSISQEEKHIEELEKVDVPKMPLTGVTVKSEDEFKGDDKDSKGDIKTCDTDRTHFQCSHCDKTFNHRKNMKRHMKIHSPEKHISCSICCKSFTQNAYLKRHMKIHSGEKDFSCSICSKGFTQRDLKIHMRTHTGEKHISCSICGKSFTHNTYLKRHMKIHSGEKDFPCSICSKGFTQKVHLKRHMSTHSEEKDFPCSICGKGFTAKCELRRHMRTHTGEKPFSCSNCKKSFSERSTLAQHMRIHTGEKPFTCSVCDKRFSDKQNLKRHTNRHTAENPFACLKCNRSFSEQANLALHMRIHNGEKPLKCSYCDKTFQYGCHLKKHTRVHTGEKRFVCSICRECFPENVDFQRHMRTHTGEKPFVCSVCGKGFCLKQGLKTHSRIHTGDKPYTCSRCNKSFTFRANLLVHMRIHTGDKPFMCSICNKRYIRKEDLVIHTRRHTGEKPFICSVCGRGFAQHANLKKHMRIHSGKKPYSCSRCNKGFTERQSLVRHLRTHTGEKEPE
ncbi:uncharacterized protein [Nerophis lumbriciformis]|uniref:uncharacterized protein n=1 Tax=Nerophis lumbriciformis TaxID=546530 RepID=UPI003BAC932D